MKIEHSCSKPIARWGEKDNDTKKEQWHQGELKKLLKQYNTFDDAIEDTFKQEPINKIMNDQVSTE